MDLGIAGRTAFVAAASKGLGRAVATRLASEGAKVVICSRDPGRVADSVEHIQAASSGDVLGLVGDLTQAEDIERLAAETKSKAGPISILINNAGGPTPGLFDDLADEHWQAAFELNLMSAIRFSRAVLPDMKSQGWGRIINITSYSVKQPIQQLMLSNSIRLGVVGWAKTLASEVAADGVLINNVCPGWTATDRVTELFEARAQASGRTTDDVAQDIIDTIPMGRLGKPEEFADVVAFLASERASYVTGVSVAIDGGTVQSAL